MALSTSIDGYRIRWAEGAGEQAVSARVDRAANAITVTAPGSAPFTIDTVAARAVLMILSDAVYRVLEPDGPYLAIEVNLGSDWRDLREVR